MRIYPRRGADGTASENTRYSITRRDWDERPDQKRDTSTQRIPRIGAGTSCATESEDQRDRYKELRETYFTEASGVREARSAEPPTKQDDFEREEVELGSIIQDDRTSGVSASGRAPRHSYPRRLSFFLTFLNVTLLAFEFQSTATASPSFI